MRARARGEGGITTRRAVPRRWSVDLTLVLGLAAVVLALHLGRAHFRPYDAPEIDPSPVLLPLYLFRSLVRLALAWVIAVVVAVGVGALAAASPRARRVILPVLDVLQSVPILGFFPVAVGFFITIAGGSALGVEAAAVFLIFTSMFWNLAFGVYESLITIPEDLTLAASQFGLSGALRWSRLLLPAALPGLLYNSLVSWANGWYFLIASEIMAVGPARYTLPGLGSYLAQAVTVGRNDLTALALVALLATTIAMHLLVWGPLSVWADRFRMEESGDAPRTPRIGLLLGRSRIVRGVTRSLATPLAQQALSVAAGALHTAARYAWVLATAGLVTVAAGLGVLGWRVLRLFLDRPLAAEIADIPVDLGLSLLRVIAGVVISAVVALPLAQVIAERRRARAAALTVIQILASIPATAFFPLVVGLVTLGLGMNVGAVLLALTTMFWYVLFNVVGAAFAIPRELNEAAAGFGLVRLRYMARVFVPAVLPGLITGCVTAWGAGWNALILCEYLEAGRQVYRVRGIGATLDHATWVTGDLQVVAACLLSMVALIVAVNRWFWDPLYQLAAERYKLDS